MKPKQYLHVPIKVEAMQYDGTLGNTEAIFQWLGAEHGIPAGTMKAADNSEDKTPLLTVETPKGNYGARVNDYIVVNLENSQAAVMSAEYFEKNYQAQ